MCIIVTNMDSQLRVLIGDERRKEKNMTAEILDYRIKQLNHITGINIFDDKSFDEALYKLIGMYSNLKKQNMEIRAKAIDEFAEVITAKLPKVEKDERVSKMAFVADMIFLVDGIAEKMKAGAENE